MTSPHTPGGPTPRASVGSRPGGYDTKRRPADDAKMLTALIRLRQTLVAIDLPFDQPDVAELRAARLEMIDQLEDYLIPRLMSFEAPMLAVVGGSTGAGKSTLVNSLVGKRVTASGVLRPTTRSPVLVHHPRDRQWFGQDRLLPDLARVYHATDKPTSLQLVPSSNVPPGVAILDAPDVDSVEERNRTLAAELMAAADLWVFVTSAARYADQVPWEFLRSAADRSTSVAIVLDRTPDDAARTVAPHLARMLASRGLKEAPLFVVPEGKVDDDGLLPADHVADIRTWLRSLAADVDARSALVRRTLDGAVRAITHRCYPIADASAAQAVIAVELASEADGIYDATIASTTAATGDGSLMRGELQARWDEFVGTGDLLRAIEAPLAGLRGRLVNTLKGKPQQAEQVSEAVERSLEALLLERAEDAAARTFAAWSEHPYGATLLEGAAARDAGLSRAATTLRDRAAQLARDWHEEVVGLLRDEGTDKRTSARYLAFGVGGLSVALEIEVFTRNAGAPPSAGRALLDAVFGQEAVSSMIERTGRSLERRLSAALNDERARFVSLIDGLVLEPDAAEQLRNAARRVDDLRFQAAKSDTRDAGGPGEAAGRAPGEAQ
ncbi:dynamin family protein [Nocardioides sp. GXZ039]|uniref:dynamin family protein n=1 Tax=Nocardioides sp. GXZ039 TaxID=3136018 RepID=UPI0030F39D98